MINKFRLEVASIALICASVNSTDEISPAMSIFLASAIVRSVKIIIRRPLAQ